VNFIGVLFSVLTEESLYSAITWFRAFLLFIPVDTKSLQTAYIW